MGQARRRGSFEKRKAESIERQAIADMNYHNWQTESAAYREDYRRSMGKMSQSRKSLIAQAVIGTGMAFGATELNQIMLEQDG